MKIVITGATGFIGSYLCQHLVSHSHSVSAIGRRLQPPFQHNNFSYISADISNSGAWQEAFNGADAAINLAGQSIFHYWTDSYKKKIRSSRVFTTRNVAQAVKASNVSVFINASATGYYGDCGNQTLTEDSPCGNDFLAAVCHDWENEATAVQSKTTRVHLPRFGIVLGTKGGALKQMIPPFRFYAGGPLGSGRQWMPWIHIHDLAEAMRFIIDNPLFPPGPVNFAAPGVINNIDFSKTLAAALKRPCWLPVPAMLIRLFLGELGQVVLFSQKVLPQMLQSNGFIFSYPEAASALHQILAATQ